MIKDEPNPTASQVNRDREGAGVPSTQEEHPLPHGRGSPETNRAGGFGSSRFLLHFLVLLVFLGLWTWKLLEPNPVPEAISEKLRGDVRFAAAKSLHAGGYAFLTLLAVTLPVPNYWRWFFVGLLALHGMTTEIGQTFVPGRDGNVRDVLIDWAGVCAAVIVWRVFLASGGREPPVVSSAIDQEDNRGLTPPARQDTRPPAS